MVHACYCSTWETKASGSEVQGYFELHSKFMGHLGFLRLCLKEKDWIFRIQRKSHLECPVQPVSLQSFTHPPILPPFCFCFCFVTKYPGVQGIFMATSCLSFLECRDRGSELYTWSFPLVLYRKYFSRLLCGSQPFLSWTAFPWKVCGKDYRTLIPTGRKGGLLRSWIKPQSEQVRRSRRTCYKHLEPLSHQVWPIIESPKWQSSFWFFFFF